MTEGPGSSGERRNNICTPLGNPRPVLHYRCMPASGFNKNVVEGVLAFVRGCYLDLLDEVRSGKHASYEEAIEFELGQIEKVLSRLHITPKGDLVER